ncbi:MAG TPA: hypothetical protein PLA28_14345, partial [Ottowia sp.]|nr:hypothetical protein [Ottowia sp.]
MTTHRLAPQCRCCAPARSSAAERERQVRLIRWLRAEVERLFPVLYERADVAAADLSGGQQQRKAQRAGHQVL